MKKYLLAALVDLMVVITAAIIVKLGSNQPEPELVRDLVLMIAGGWVVFFIPTYRWVILK